MARCDEAVRAHLMSAAVAVKDLHVIRGGREVLRGVTFTVRRGTVTGLIGPNGGGKTTLMRSIVGVQIVAGGTVTVLGEPAGSERLRNRVGYSTQAPAVYADLSVKENLRYFASVLRTSRGDVDRVIGEVGLDDARDQLVSSLSGGQLARTSLGVALLGHPELLVLDEPTVGLDPILRDELWTLFSSLAHAGITLLVSSHVMDEAARCQRLLLIHDGRILADDTPEALRSRSGTDDLGRAFLRLVRQRKEEVTP